MSGRNIRIKYRRKTATAVSRFLGYGSVNLFSGLLSVLAVVIESESGGRLILALVSDAYHYKDDDRKDVRKHLEEGGGAHADVKLAYRGDI